MGYKKLMDAAGAVVSVCYGSGWCIGGIAAMLA